MRWSGQVIAILPIDGHLHMYMQARKYFSYIEKHMGRPIWSGHIYYTIKLVA